MVCFRLGLSSFHFIIHLILYCYKLMTNAYPLGRKKGNVESRWENFKSINNTLHTSLHTDTGIILLLCNKKSCLGLFRF